MKPNFIDYPSDSEGDENFILIFYLHPASGVSVGEDEAAASFIDIRRGERFFHIDRGLCPYYYE